MLPGSLVSTYQQYKEDTNAVASWLASTAKLCGCPADLLSTDSAPDGGGSKRLGGQARKEAKQATAQQHQKPVGKSGPKYTIAIKNFVPLAEIVAASKEPLVSVPPSITATLERVISTRLSFGDRLAEHGAAPSLRSDVQHSHFVHVLQRVQEILKPCTSPPTEAASPSAPSFGSVSALSLNFTGLMSALSLNFTGLTVYLSEPSEDFLHAPLNIERLAPVKDDSATYEVEPLMDLEEALFAYTTMLNDLAKIRAHVEWIWKNFRDGMFDLAAAAVTTNTACDLARDLMEDMGPIFKAHGGALKTAKKFHLYQCLVKGFSLESISNPPSDNFNYDTYDVATDTCMISFLMLASFLTVLDPDHLPLYKEGMFGVYDPSRDWNTMSNRDKFIQDKILMMEYFTELMTVVRCVPNYPVQDEFLRGMKELDQTREIPMYLAFAAQLFLDIHHILREKVSTAQKTCMSHVALMNEDLALHLEFHKNLWINTWPASNDHELKEMQRKIKWIQEDPVYQAMARVYGSRGVPTSMPVHRILTYSPVLSGLMLYHFRAEMYDVGIAVANAWGSLAYALHLHVALQQEELVPREAWQDMSLVLGLLGTSTFFVGGELPKRPEDYMKMFCLQMGTSVSALRNSKHKRIRNLDNLLSRSGPRGIKGGVPVSDMFMDRYLRNTGQVDWTPEHIDDIVSRSLYEEEEGSEADGTLLLGQMEDPEKLRERKKKAGTRSNAHALKTAKGARLSPDKLVRALALALQAESLELAFPYLTLHRFAWTMLGAVRDACDPLLRELYGPAYMERESQLPWVVGWICLAALEGDTRLLREAAGVVRARTQEGDGAKVMRKLLEMGFDVEIVNEQDLV